MKASTDVTVSNSQTQQWELIQRQCDAFLKSGFLPQSIKNIAQAVTIAWKGHELGWPPLYAFSKISVINGKPALEAEGMLALIYRKFPEAKISFKTPVEKQHQECTIEMTRPGGEAQVFRFTIDDAKRAGLLSKNTWAQYPAAMLRARVIAAGARAVFPDALMGVSYTPEELGAVVDVDGAVVEEAGGRSTHSTHVVLEDDEIPVKKGAVTRAVNDALANGASAIEVKYPPKLPFEEGYSKTTEFPKGNLQGGCSEAQVKRLYAIGKNAGLSHEQMKLKMQQKFPGLEHFNEMTKAEIQVLFDEIEKMPQHK